jgi:hypothetical protein
MSKSSPRTHSKPPTSHREIAESGSEPEMDLKEANLQVDYWGDSWAFRLAMLAVLGATLLLWTIVIFDYFAGAARDPAGPGTGRI